MCYFMGMWTMLFGAAIKDVSRPLHFQLHAGPEGRSSQALGHALAFVSWLFGELMALNL